MTLNELDAKIVAQGWNTMKKGTYPRPLLWDWLKITHPELIEEFKEHFDTLREDA